MAEEILEGRIHAGDKVSVGLNKEKIRFTVQREIDIRIGKKSDFMVRFL